MPLHHNAGRTSDSLTVVAIQGGGTEPGSTLFYQWLPTDWRNGWRRRSLPKCPPATTTGEWSGPVQRLSVGLWRIMDTIPWRCYCLIDQSDLHWWRHLLPTERTIYRLKLPEIETVCIDFALNDGRCPPVLEATPTSPPPLRNGESGPPQVMEEVKQKWLIFPLELFLSAWFSGLTRVYIFGKYFWNIEEVTGFACDHGWQETVLQDLLQQRWKLLLTTAFVWIYF